MRSNIENNRIREEKLIEKEKQAETIRADVNALARAHGARSNWVTTLSGGSQYRFKPILSIELERVWINNGPIVFWGSLKDIVTLDENHYEVMFERTLWASSLSTWVQKLFLQTVISVFRLFEDVRAAAHHSRPVGCILCLSGLPR